MHPIKTSKIYQQACLSELQALKPGNVHIFADMHDMDVMHFVKSAEVSAPKICRDGYGVGARVFSAMQATYKAVGMNTNLGILLLCAPILCAHEKISRIDRVEVGNLRSSLNETLKELSVEDGQLASKAIMIANPAGLGKREEYDVAEMPEVSLLRLMQASAGEDRIAYQYANGYPDIFDFGMRVLEEGVLRWERLAWATSWLYLNLLCEMPDSHIIRKYDLNKAELVREEANVLRDMWQDKGHPKYITRALLDWDQSLKQRRLNPGTSADLTVCTLLIGGLCKSLLR